MTAAHNWQPIDTAPHDGTWVWVLFERNYEDLSPRRHMRLVVWSTMDSAWFCPYTREPIRFQLAMFVIAWHPFARPELPPKEEFETGN